MTLGKKPYSWTHRTHPLKMPIERIDFIDTCLFHNDQGKGIVDTDTIFLCPLDTVPVIVC